jgi:aminoglycoside 2'-N-acetyltransferase I
LTEPSLLRLRTEELTAPQVDQIREILWAAFPRGDEGFTEDDWEHGLGGTHFVLEEDARVIAHGSVVERELHVGGVALRTGYVESVAVAPALQGQRHGTGLMREVTSFVRDGYELGALGTGRHAFYERLGWRTWRGPSGVRTETGVHRTTDEDGYILVLETRLTPPLDPSELITCEWRPGDVW